MSRAQRSSKTAAMRKPRDPEQTRGDILLAATQEFAARGLKGARVDAVAKRTRTTRAMIYYYFKSKEELYLSVLENAYRGIREAEKTLDLAHLEPVEAMRRLVAFTFDYYQTHPTFVELVVAENQAGGRYIKKVTRMHRLNVSIIDTISAVLHVGAIDGVFRSGIDPVDVHMTIAALGWYQIAKRHTIGYMYDRDMGSRAHIEHARALVTEIVLRFLAPEAPVGRRSRKRSIEGILAG
jgi:AcrR family transcriptional regulator